MTAINTQPKGWKETTLGEVAEIFTGRKDVNQTNPKGEYIFFSCSPELFHSDEYIGDGDAIIIVGNGSYTGTARFFSGKFDLYQRTYACVLKEKAKQGFDIKFIFYYVKKYFEQDFMGGSRGSSIPYIVRGDIENFEIPNPSLSEQREIAGVLSSLDDKIELLRKQNETLEAIARTIFHEWFVEFNFPNEKCQPYKSSGGKMVDSELGEIPAGWRVVAASDFADISIGRTPPRKENEWFSLNSLDNKWLSIRDLGSSGVFVNQTAEYLTNEAISRFQVPKIPKNTVVVSFKLTVGRVAIAAEDMYSNEAIAQFKQKDRKMIPTEYVYLWLKNFDFDSLGSTSSIATATNSQAIKQIPFLIPDGRIMSGFNKVVVPFFAKIKENTRSIAMLSLVRDALLPKLMSGEVRVKI